MAAAALPPARSAARVRGATTRYCCPPRSPPVARLVLVNGLETWLRNRRRALTRFPPSVTPAPIGRRRARSVRTRFSHPLPRQPLATLDLPVSPMARRVEQEIFVHQATGRDRPRLAVAQPFRRQRPTRPRTTPALFRPRLPRAPPRERRLRHGPPVPQGNNGPGNALWQPYPGIPGTRVWTSGTYRHDPAWYRTFLYTEERARGLDDTGGPRRARRLHLRPGRATARGRHDPRGRRQYWRPRVHPAAAARRPPARTNSCPPCAPTRTAAAPPWATATPCAARATPTSCAAGAEARRSSPVTRGSPIGAATRSSPCADYVSPRAGSPRRAKSSCNGPARSPRACCPTASPTAARPPNTTRWTPPCGSSSAVHDYLAISSPTPRRSRRAWKAGSHATSMTTAGHLRGHSHGLRRRDALRHPRSTRTDGLLSPRAHPAAPSR